MTLDLAIRLTEILLGWALLQSSAEHVFGPTRATGLFLPRMAASLLLLAGLFSGWCLLFLSGHSLAVLRRYGGPYNGGSDRMGLLILYCLTAAHWLPPGGAQELAIGYLAMQVTLSYFISGRVKIVNPDWRNGQALQDVFAFSAYPVSDALRALAHHHRLLLAASWAVIVLELLFPFALLHPTALNAALVLTAVFHVANACLFGLNRFVWAWLAAYPSLIWLQTRVDQLVWG